MRRDRYDVLRDKAAAVRRAEAAGEIADSKSVRLQLLERVKRGEMTLEQCQAELERIKRGAKAAGQVTRAQAWRRG